MDVVADGGMDRGPRTVGSDAPIRDLLGLRLFTDAEGTGGNLERSSPHVERFRPKRRLAPGEAK